MAVTTDLPAKTPKPKKPKKYKAGATLEDGTYVRSSLELQILEPVKNLVPDPSPNLGGRPTIYNEELALRICNHLAQGKTLIEACEQDNTLPNHFTIRKWANENWLGFAAKYMHARDLGLDAMAEQLFKIADDGSQDWIQKTSAAGTSFVVPDHEHMARSRLRIETRKWYLSKLAPKKYGDRVDVTITNNEQSDIGTMLADVMSPAELDDLKQRILAYKALKSKQLNGQSSPANQSGTSDIMSAGNEIDPTSGL